MKKISITAAFVLLIASAGWTKLRLRQSQKTPEQIPSLKVETGLGCTGGRISRSRYSRSSNTSLRTRGISFSTLMETTSRTRGCGTARSTVSRSRSFRVSQSVQVIRWSFSGIRSTMTFCSRNSLGLRRLLRLMCLIDEREKFRLCTNPERQVPGSTLRLRPWTFRAKPGPRA